MGQTVRSRVHSNLSVFNPITWLLTALLLEPLQAPIWAAAPPKRARPPHFGKSITDVFFPDARAKLVGPRPEKSGSTSLPPSASLAPSQSAGAAQGGPWWSKLIAADVVEDEIKAQQLELGETVQTVSKFKGGDYQRARLHFSVLATMFAIDAQYDGALRWQREAPALRDLMARAGFNCKVGTDGSYKEAKARYEDLQNLVRGSPMQAPSAGPEADWPKVADRPPLMKRLEQAQQQGLAVWSASAGEFSRHADEMLHEAQLIAALAEVIAREGYEFADDEIYRGFALAMQIQALAVRDAVEQKNYEHARQAVGEISKACANCHEGFRN
ncbi:MAG: hypothetical protein HY288_16930 [Planctomycetia bacterium]|nr:hypothetical protein [Planctomycetia bacterium]